MNKIICKHVPEGLLKKEAAKNHFRRFGSVKRIVFKTASQTITVEYNGAEAVEKVLKYGNIFENKIFTISKDPGIHTEQSTKAIRKKIPKESPSVNLPDDVMAELEAMGGGPSIGLARKKYSRQEVISTDLPKKSLKRRVPIDKDKGITKKNKPLAFYDNDEYQELLEILNQPAVTIEDKYKVLDARDKILRLVQKKNGTKNGFTKGTCPDMCPEKERLLRVIQHQVSYFEQNSAKEMDPCLAVKQYSRSSADQESPLPHELRPVGVLQTTMSYLINNIMPLDENSNVNIGDWFHFLWDRTRSIRKDITQQELCCRNTVDLLEQCARFHIHCSARLVAEDPSVFDQKINTENLTKCLQTLKYMYHDLRLKGETCSNEAEFRAYIILLNLNDGNFMWEVQRLPVEIQESPQIRHAIQIYLALNAYNFVKFFKLVRSSSYLNACILMRYFMQVRSRAIDVILRCYTPRITKVVYPLDTLTVNLGFESVHQTIEFVQLCGLNINDTRTSVILDKTSFIAPDLTYTAIDRSINLVESKRTGLSLGQIVCGSIVPKFNLHVPQSSFNDEGYLDKPFNAEDFEDPRTEVDMVNAEVASEPIPEIPKELPNIAILKESSLIDSAEDEIDSEPLESVPPPQEDINDEVEMSEVSSQKDEKFDDKPNIVADNHGTFSIFGNKNVFTNASIFGNTLNPPISNIFGGDLLSDKKWSGKNDKAPVLTLNDEPKETKKLEKGEVQSGFFSPALVDTNTQLVKEPPPKGLVDIFFSTPSSLPKIKQNLFPQPSDDKLNERSNKFLLDDKIQSFQQTIRENKENVEEENTKIESIEQKQDLNSVTMKESKTMDQIKEIRSEVKSLVFELVERVVSKEAFIKLKQLKSNILKRKILRIINKWRAFAVNKKKARQMREWTCGWVNNMISLREQAAQLRIISKPSKLKGMNTGLKLESLAEQEKNIDFMELTEILSERHKSFYLKNYSNQPRDKIYWKCIISVPDSVELPEEFQFINEKLQRYFNLKDDGSPLVVQNFSAKTPVRICIETQMGTGNENNDADGLIFIAKNLNDHLVKRILNKFKNTGIFFKVPIVLILQQKPKEFLNLKTLLNDGIISGYLMLSDCSHINMLNLMERSLKFLTSNANPPPPIEVNYLENVLFRNFLCSEVWKNASCYGINDPSYGKCLKHPNTVIQLYNDSLRRMKSFILDKSCYEYARFPLDFRQLEEFPDCFPMDYRYLPDISDDQGYQQLITSIFDSVMPLHTFASWPPKNEKELRKIIWEFAIENFENRAVEVSYKILAHLNTIMESNQYDIKVLEDIMWTDLMDIFISEKYRCYEQFLKERTILESWQYHNQILVVYHLETLPRFLKSDWFYLTIPIIQEILSYDEVLPVNSDSVSNEPTNREIEETISRVKSMLTREKPDIFRCNIKELNAQIDDLSESLRITRTITRHFNDIV